MRKNACSVSYLLLLFLSACIISNTDHVIFEKVCSLPCWANITPGLSREDDIRAIEDNIPKINVNQKVWKENREGYEALFKWQFIDSEEQIGTIYINNDIVESIILFGGFQISLDHLFKNYGEPDYVIVGNTISPGILGAGYQNQVNLIYEKGGLIIKLKPNKNAIIKPNTRIDSVVYFDPGLHERIILEWISPGLLGELKIWDWQGYGRFTLEGERK